MKSDSEFLNLDVSPRLANYDCDTPVPTHRIRSAHKADNLMNGMHSRSALLYHLPSTDVAEYP